MHISFVVNRGASKFYVARIKKLASKDCFCSEISVETRDICVLQQIICASDDESSIKILIKQLS